MRKFLFLIAIIFNLFTCANADVMPYCVSNINSSSMGVYQAENNFKIYSQPNENSKLIANVSYDKNNYNCVEISAGNLFLVFMPQKELAFLTVVDDNEDWIQIVANKSNNMLGWVKKSQTDPYRYLPWRIFYNTYGKKYGLYILKDAPDNAHCIFSGADSNAQLLNRLNYPQKIKLTTIKGNWALVSVLDMDKMPKTGFMPWRNQNGEIFAFPAIK